jgi:hypothetical protein
MSLQLAGAVTESVGVLVVGTVGLAYGVLVGANVAVTNCGVVFGGVGVVMESVQAVRVHAAKEIARILLRINPFYNRIGRLQ